MNSMARFKSTRNYITVKEASPNSPEGGACWDGASFLHPRGHGHGHVSCIARVMMNEPVCWCLHSVPMLRPTFWCSGRASSDSSQNPLIISDVKLLPVSSMKSWLPRPNVICWIEGSFLHFLAITKKYLLSAQFSQRCLGFRGIIFSYVIIPNLQKSCRKSIENSHIPFTQIHQLFTFYSICFIILCN